MQILEVQLRNIRSYEELDLSFQQGMTLLTGDIGAGKSTILQAIEFVLFGIQRGGLEGESLLRHGTESGSVAVLFAVAGKEVRVSRNLRRSKDGVRQAEGELSVNGNSQTLSAVELKARVLELIGYPDQLLTKSKGLIFRYTVYTPQEEMKHILFMQPEERLNTLRVLFGIDKYKTVKENTQLLLKELRVQERQLSAQASLVPQLEREVSVHASQETAASEVLNVQKKLVEKVKMQLEAAREELRITRLAYDAQQLLAQQRQLLTHKITELTRSHNNCDEDMKRLDEYLAVPLTLVTDSGNQLEELHSHVRRADEELLQLSSKIGETAGHAKLLSEQAGSITKMDTCPVCQQQVTSEHKHHIETQSNAKRDALLSHSRELEAQASLLRKRKAELQEQLAKLNEQQRKFASYQRELMHRKDQEFQKERLRLRKADIAAELQRAQEELAETPLPDAGAAELHNQSQTALRAAETQYEEQLQKMHASQEMYTRAYSQHLLVAERLTAALESQASAARLQTNKVWLEEQFLPVVSIIEQHVLTAVHAEFSQLFCGWFDQLIEDDTIQVSLGEQFEPLVSQNGYDASLEQLSGGEKTAVALAYRLSLYKVVSDFISTIATKDLLILDEPTDGFSAEQLERVKDVLRSLSCEQIIMVSHEVQMEGLCDHVVRIRKQNHRSSY